MAEYTTNYNLRKPGQEDFYNVEDFNSNADIVDGALKGIKEDLNTHAADQTNPHKVTAAQVGASNPNLLINTNFLNPVNQRGQSLYSNITGYTVDRWFLKTGGAGSAAVGQNGITINNTGAPASYVAWTQNLEFPIRQGTTVTLSWGDKDGTYSGTGDVVYSDGLKYFSVAYKAGSSPNYARCATWRNIFYVEFICTTTITPEWVKLEFGSVATPFVPRSYGEELAECQRYFIKQNSWTSTPYSMIASTDRALNGSIVFPATMRIAPTIKITGMRSNSNGACPVVDTFSLQYGADGINAIHDMSFVSDPPVQGQWYAIDFEADAEIY